MEARLKRLLYEIIVLVGIKKFIQQELKIVKKEKNENFSLNNCRWKSMGSFTKRALCLYSANAWRRYSLF